MKVAYLPTFVKDLKKLKHQAIYHDLQQLVFHTIPAYSTLSEIPHIKKLKGEKQAYRIRLKDYRIGFFVEDDQIIFSRVLHRQEIYKRFP